MLKIKDNIDLTELEKFGFEYVDRYKAYMLYNVDELLTISIMICNRIIYCYSDSATTGYEPLFDLIKADLVEKVVKNEE